uniref:Large ribosomal subunit protein uL4c n=1 Tax=Costaria costata TaxID=2872 RepID=A0A0S0GAN7_COSCS|nr:50S ribosomal protein L4 [Costaria costata]ALF62976.1 50S ribosomal protein L4 [Costaria costata]QWK43851.1 ribosomal protein L4 [Costaria costata]WAM62452.1 50S ribosomal protein L4 [Costaria costata]
MILQKILTFPIKILTGEESGDEITLTLKSKEATNTINYVIQRAYLAQRSNERQGTANTLTRAEVKGGGRKPWRQKGTGRARAGSNRSPLWKGGGVSFGPKPKLYSSKINRKEWQLSLRSLLIAKQKDITIIDNFNFLEYKTSNIIKVLNTFGINLFENTLIVVPKIEEKLLKSTRNIKTIKLIVANNLNLKQILLAKNLLITKDSLKTIEETYNG